MEGQIGQALVMSYESWIGWRYVHRTRHAHRALLMGLFLAFVGIAVISGASFYLTAKPSPFAVLVMTIALVGAIILGLLRYFSVFTTVSVCGVVFGVASLSVVLSVTSGFQERFRDHILGVNAHVLVMKSTTDFANYADVEDVARTLPHVTAVQPFEFVEMLITRGKGVLSGIALKGVDPDRVGTVLDLPKHMIAGTVSALKQSVGEGLSPIIIGRALAEKLDVGLGGQVTVVSPLAGGSAVTWSKGGVQPKTKKFVVVGIFYCGFEEYDRRLTYVALKDLQDFLEHGDVVRGVEMKLDVVDEAPKVARALDERLNRGFPERPYNVLDWREPNKSLFVALVVQKAVLLVLLTLIVVVAAFNMIASLTMMVFDKTKEIAIMKTMGATDLGVARLFQVVGMAIGGIGTVLGLGLGLFLSTVVARFGYPLDPKVYLIDKLPIRIHPTEVLLVGVITLLICLAATVYPALRASRLRPSQGLRYE